MHCHPPDDKENAFYITGVAQHVSDTTVLKAVAATFLPERSWPSPPPGFDEQELFEFLIERALLTTTAGQGTRTLVIRYGAGPSVQAPVAKQRVGAPIAGIARLLCMQASA